MFGSGCRVVILQMCWNFARLSSPSCVVTCPVTAGWWEISCRQAERTMTLFSSEENNRVVGLASLLWSLLDVKSREMAEVQSSRLKLHTTSDLDCNVLPIRRNVDVITMALQQQVLLGRCFTSQSLDKESRDGDANRKTRLEAKTKNSLTWWPWANKGRWGEWRKSARKTERSYLVAPDTWLPFDQS